MGLKINKEDEILIINGLKAERSRCYNDKDKVNKINNLLHKIKVIKWVHNQKNTNQTKDKEDKHQKFVVTNRTLKKEVYGEALKGSVVQVASVGKA